MTVLAAAPHAYIINDKLQVFEVPRTSNIHIADALVSKEFDTRQEEQIYAKSLVLHLLHLNSLTNIVGLKGLQKTLLENSLQVAKSCMSIFCIIHLLSVWILKSELIKFSGGKKIQITRLACKGDLTSTLVFDEASNAVILSKKKTPRLDQFVGFRF